MPMSSVEVMQAAVRFGTPDRLPVVMGSLGYSDCFQFGLGHKSERTETGVGLDDWGCRWEKSSVANMGQVRGHPIDSPEQIADYPVPDPEDPTRIESIERQLDSPEAQGRYIIAGQFMILFERMHSLMGMAAVLEGIATESVEVAHLADRIVEYDVRTIELIGERFGNRIHSYGGTDDWGTQLAPFVSPAMWESFFLPRYRRIFGAAHEFGWNVRLHSCGRINDLIPLMSVAGVDALNMQQPRAYGIEEIGTRFRGRMCFESLCDIQATLPRGDLDEIRSEAKLLLEQWPSAEGGFVLSDYGDSEAIGADPAVKEVMLRAFLEHDPFAQRSGVRHPAWKLLDIEEPDR